MLSCEQFLSLLDAYTDGSLSPEQKQEMEDHSARCSHCRTLVQMKTDLNTLRAETENMPMPESLSQAWHTRIQKEDRRHLPLKRALPGLLTAAAALAFTVVGTSRHRNIPAAESAPKVMMARLGPAPVPTVWERITAYLGDMGAFLLENWLILGGILLFGLVLPITLPRLLGKNCSCRRKKG